MDTYVVIVPQHTQILAHHVRKEYQIHTMSVKRVKILKIITKSSVNSENHVRFIRVNGKII